MEALYVQPLGDNGVVTKEEELDKTGEQEEEEMEASSPTASVTDEETDEDSEPEPPPLIRRKVSFADAFGLNLVSVKEFDNAEATEAEVSLPPESEATRPVEEFHMSCLFTVPSSPEELDDRLRSQMVELESIELLRGTTTIRGIIRVVNLCYTKSVFARMSLDRWTSYFDLLAEYVPGSSDRKTDRFSFKYPLVPPFEREGTRLEICLRYETPVGTFWANNKEMNYVLFFHQKVQANEQVQEESVNHRGKRSCLKANRRGSAEEMTRGNSNKSTVVADTEATYKGEEADRKDTDSAEIRSLLYHKEQRPLVDNVKSRHRAPRLAHVLDNLSQRRQHVSKAYSHDSASGQKVSQPLPTPWVGSASVLDQPQKKQANESTQVLTYHQIPLLTLDWNNDKAHQWGTAEVDDIWTGSHKMTLSKASGENIADDSSGNDMWDTDDTTHKDTSVCDVWQAFLNGPSCMDHSGVPESEWLQTAASVSPSNDKGPKNPCAVSSHEHEFEVGTDTPTTLHTSAACQLLSDACETSLADVALNTADHQSAEAYASSPGDDKTATQDASQRSETISVTDTPQESSLVGATPVSDGSVDSSSMCHKRAMWEQEAEGIKGGAEGIGGHEPSTPHTADLVTSSGESETTDMTATTESQNASAVDRISHGARLGDGLSSSREGQVTSSAHNAMDDTLAFRGTIRQGTKDGERFVSSTSRQGEEEEIVRYCTETKVSTEEAIFRPQKTEECEISQRYADEKKREEFKLNQNRENPLQENEGDENEARPAQSHADEVDPNQTCEDNLKHSQITAREFTLEESENEALEVLENTEVEPSCCTTSREAKRLTGAEAETFQVLNEKAHNDKALQLHSSWQRGKISVISGAKNEQSRPIQAGEEPCIQKKEGSRLTQTQENVKLKSETGEHVLISNQTKEGKSLSCDGTVEGQREINPSAQTRCIIKSKEMEKVFQKDHDTLRPFPTDKCSPFPVDVVELRLEEDMKGQKEDIGHEISPLDVLAMENVAKEDTSREPQHQPKTLERLEENMSQRDEDERVRIGRLKIEALGDLMGNVGIPQGERKNAPAQSKERESSAEVESPTRVEFKKLSEGTKDPIVAENAIALDVIDPGLEETVIERFAEDLVREVWEEVFNWKAKAFYRGTNVVDRLADKLADIPDITQDCQLHFEKDFNDDFDSGVFSLTELPSDPNLSQGFVKTSVAKSNEYSQPLTPTERTPFRSESQIDANSSAHLSRDLAPVIVAQSRQSLTESAQSSPNDQENYSQIKERSVTGQERGRQIEGCAVIRKESVNLSERPSHKHLSSSSEKLKESDGVVWWSLLYILSHITRLLICAFMVAGFFFVVFLYDFPAFFALYVFSLSWWVYKLKRHRVTTNKGPVG